MLILSSNIEYRVHKHITYLYGRRSYPGTVRDRYLNGLVWVCGANRPLLGQSVDIMLQPYSFDFGTTDSDRFLPEIEMTTLKVAAQECLKTNIWIFQDMDKDGISPGSSIVPLFCQKFILQITRSLSSTFLFAIFLHKLSQEGFVKR